VFTLADLSATKWDQEIGPTNRRQKFWLGRLIAPICQCERRIMEDDKPRKQLIN